MGRPRKPIELHKLHGSYRKDRHGPVPTEAQPVGDDDDPAVFRYGNLSEGGADLFNELVDSLDWLQPSDSPMLNALCEVFELFAHSLAIVRKSPKDRVARKDMLKYLEVFNSMASKFGLTPSDRAKLLATRSYQPPIASTNGIAKRNRYPEFDE